MKMSIKLSEPTLKSAPNTTGNMHARIVVAHSTLLKTCNKNVHYTAVLVYFPSQVTRAGHFGRRQKRPVYLAQPVYYDIKLFHSRNFPVVLTFFAQPCRLYFLDQPIISYCIEIPRPPTRSNFRKTPHFIRTPPSSHDYLRQHDDAFASRTDKDSTKRGCHSFDAAGIARISCGYV